MARWTPATITAWRFGRLLKAVYWNVHLIVKLVGAGISWPPCRRPEWRAVSVWRRQSRRQTWHQESGGPERRISQHHPWFFGLRFRAVDGGMGQLSPAGWAFGLFCPNAMRRIAAKMSCFARWWKAFVPPQWAKLVICGRDAAYGSKRTYAWSKTGTKPTAHAAGALSLRLPVPGRL